jgi:hypothetical protein
MAELREKTISAAAASLIGDGVGGLLPPSLASARSGAPLKKKQAGSGSLGDTWSDTTTPRGPLLPTVPRATLRFYETLACAECHC